MFYIISLSFNIKFNRAPQLQRFFFLIWIKTRENMMEKKNLENIQIKFKSDRSHYKTLIDRFSALYSLLVSTDHPIIIKLSLKTERPMIVLLSIQHSSLWWLTYCYKTSNWVLSFISLSFLVRFLLFHLRNVFIRRREPNTEKKMKIEIKMNCQI